MNYMTIDKIDHSRIMEIKANFSTELLVPTANIFMLSLISSGNCVVEICGITYYIEAPAMICLDERKKIKVISSNSLDVKTIYFNPAFINRNMTIDTIRSAEYPDLIEKHSFLQLSPFMEHNDSYPSFFNLDSSLFLKLEEAMDKCKEQLENQEDWYWSCRARSYFTEILMHIERIYHNYNVNQNRDVLQTTKISGDFTAVLEYIDVNLKNLKGIDEVCQKFKINRTTMQLYFKNTMGITYYDYITKLRLENATHMLCFTSLILDEIAFRIGYSSTQNFCKFFKNNMKISPNQFRKTEVSERIQWQNGKAN